MLGREGNTLISAAAGCCSTDMSHQHLRLRHWAPPTIAVLPVLERFWVEIGRMIFVHCTMSACYCRLVEVSANQFFLKGVREDQEKAQIESTSQSQLRLMVGSPSSTELLETATKHLALYANTGQSADLADPSHCSVCKCLSGYFHKSRFSKQMTWPDCSFCINDMPMLKTAHDASHMTGSITGSSKRLRCSAPK